MSKKAEITKCVYCGREKETTKDHVISKCLFHSSYKKKNPIVLPSCGDCNNSFSKDEEYFRNFVCPLALGHSQDANTLFSSTIKRSILRRPGIGYRVMSKMALVKLYTKSGIYIGQRTKITITPADWRRYFNVLDKYIKGLFFFEFREVLPIQYKIKHFWGRKEQLEIFNRINKWNTDNKEIFFYGYSFIPETYTSIWVTIFYDKIFFISFVATDKDSLFN